MKYQPPLPPIEPDRDARSRTRLYIIGIIILLLIAAILLIFVFHAFKITDKVWIFSL